MPVDSPTTEPLPVCPACGEEIENEDATAEGDTVFHFGCIGVTDE